MLTLEIPTIDVFDEDLNEFVTIKGPTKLQLEHSLISISKWESKWHIAFLEEGNKTPEQTIDYIKCMTINNVPDQRIYDYLPTWAVLKIKEYIDNPMTASWVREDKKEGEAKSKTPPEKITSELIYYWMIALNIPFECEKWHIARLLMLVRICEKKNQTPEKKTKKELMAERAALNAKRRAKHHTRG